MGNSMTENPWNLTPPQILVIEALTQFGATKLIAKNLGLSVKAVENYRANIRRRMRVTNMTLAAVMWDRHVRGGK